MTINVRYIYLILATIIGFIIYWAITDKTKYTIEDVGAIQIQTPTIYKAWWDSTAQCLGVKSPYKSDVKVYIGKQIPASWVNNSDAGISFAGYANPETNSFIVQAKDTLNRAMVTHELWHLHFGSTHPKNIFYPPKCGMARP